MKNKEWINLYDFRFRYDYKKQDKVTMRCEKPTPLGVGWIAQNN